MDLTKQRTSGFLSFISQFITVLNLRTMLIFLMDMILVDMSGFHAFPEDAKQKGPSVSASGQRNGANSRGYRSSEEACTVGKVKKSDSLPRRGKD